MYCFKQISLFGEGSPAASSLACCDKMNKETKSVLFILPRLTETVDAPHLGCLNQKRLSRYTWNNRGCWSTSLLHRLQTQTLPDATQPIGQIHPIRNNTITLETMKPTVLAWRRHQVVGEKGSWTLSINNDRVCIEAPGFAQVWSIC